MGVHPAQGAQAHQRHASELGIGPDRHAAVSETVAAWRILVTVAKTQDSGLADRRKSGSGSKRKILVDILVVTSQCELQRRNRAPDPLASRNEALSNLALILSAGEKVRPIAAAVREADGKVSREPVTSARQV